MSDLARDADTIVAGTITSRFESSTLVSFDITVERIFKGDSTLHTAHVHHPWIRKVIVLGPESNTIEAKFRGIWFLRKIDSPLNSWAVLPANGCPMQTPRNTVSMQYLQFLNPSPYRNTETINAFAFRRGPEDREKQLISFWMKYWESNRASLEAN